MKPQSVTRKLAAIFHADVKDCSRLIGEAEVTTLRAVASHLDMMRTLWRKKPLPWMTPSQMPTSS